MCEMVRWHGCATVLLVAIAVDAGRPSNTTSVGANRDGFADWLVAQTTTECRITVRPERPTFEFEGHTLTSGKVFDRRRGLTRAALCAVSRSGEDYGQRVAMVSFATDISYILSTPPGKFPLWPALVERGAFADRWRGRGAERSRLRWCRGGVAARPA